MRLFPKPLFATLVPAFCLLVACTSPVDAAPEAVQDKDVSEGFVECWELKIMRGLTEDEVIHSLFANTNRFQENAYLPYWPFPSARIGNFNSNSYVRGLGVSAGLWMPMPSSIGVRAPGYAKPVPMGYFQ